MEIKIKDVLPKGLALNKNKLKIGIANDNKGNNHFESTMSFARRHNTTLCTNAGIFNGEAPFQIWGACIIDGEIVINNPVPDNDPRSKLFNY